MAFGRLERAARPRPMSDINMTPLIDVMLVLLVIFMIAAPFMTAQLKLDLPRVGAAAPADAARALAVTLTRDGTLHVDERPVDAAVLEALLQEAARRAPQTEVMLRADRAVPYGQVAELIGRIQQAGLHRIAFVAEADAPASGPGR